MKIFLALQFIFLGLELIYIAASFPKIDLKVMWTLGGISILFSILFIATL